jgi:hypothetical protein
VTTNVRVDITGDSRSAEAAISRTRGELRHLGDDARAADGGMGGLGRTLSKVGGAVLAGGAVAKIGGWLWDATQKASDLTETLSKTDVVFGRSSKAMQDWAKKTPAALAMPQKAILDTVAGFDLLLGNKGITGAQGQAWSKKLTGLSADLASFFNVDASTAAEALTAALKGEMDPIEQFGVTLDDATLKARAFEMGLYAGKGPLDANAKAQAAYAEILRQTGKAQGDLLRTQGSAANQVRQFETNIDALKTTAGKAFTPLLERYLPGVNKFLRNLNTEANADKFGNVISKWGDKVAQVMPSIKEDFKAAGEAAKQMGSWAGSAFEAFNGLSPEAKKNIALIVGAGAALGMANRNPVIKMGVELVGSTVQSIAETVAASAASRWFGGRFAQNVNVMNWPRVYPDGSVGEGGGGKSGGSTAKQLGAAAALAIIPMILDQLPLSPGFKAQVSDISEIVTTGLMVAAFGSNPAGWAAAVGMALWKLGKDNDKQFTALDAHSDYMRATIPPLEANAVVVRGQVGDLQGTSSYLLGQNGIRADEIRAVRYTAGTALRTARELRTALYNFIYYDPHTGTYTAGGPRTRSAADEPTYWGRGPRELQPTPAPSPTQVTVVLDGRVIARHLEPVTAPRRA